MNNSPNKSNRDLVVYFLLALFFAVLTVLAKRPTQLISSGIGVGISLDTRWIFWVFLALSAMCLLPLIAFALRLLHERKVLPGFFDFLFQDKVEEGSQRFLSRMRSCIFGVIGLLVIAGGGILLLVIYIHQTRAMDDDTVTSNVYDLALQLRGVERNQEKFTHVTKLYYLTPDADLEHQVRDCAEIVKRLHDAGAKAVLISLPDFSAALSKHYRILSEIEKSGIVVWGIPMGSSRYFVPWMLDSLGGFRVVPADYLADQEDLWKGNALARVRLTYGPAGKYVGGDVTIMLLLKYLGISPVQYAANGSSADRIGDYSIPVSNQGWMYMLDRYAPSLWPEIYVHRGVDWRLGKTYWSTTSIHSHDNSMYVGKGDDLDTLRFSSHIREIGSPLSRTGYHMSADPMDTQGFEAMVKGKIVLLVSNYGAQSGSYLPDRAYAVALEDILAGKVVTKSESGYIWFSAICLVLAALISLRFRALVAILLMFLLAVCALWFGSWLFEGQGLLIEMFYPLLSIGVGIIVFPGLVFARRMGYENAHV